MILTFFNIIEEIDNAILKNGDSISEILLTDGEYYNFKKELNAAGIEVPKESYLQIVYKGITIRRM